MAHSVLWEGCGGFDYGFQVDGSLPLALKLQGDKLTEKDTQFLAVLYAISFEEEMAMGLTSFR